MSPRVIRFDDLPADSRRTWAASRVWAAHQAPYLATALLALVPVVVDQSDDPPGARFDLSAFPDLVDLVADDVTEQNQLRIGQGFAVITDIDGDALKVGQPMRMMFRIKDIDANRGFRRYYWKAAPTAGKG